MSLLQALDHALAAQQAAAVLDGDGSALSGSQLLRLAAAAARLVQQAASDAPCAAPGAPPVCAVFLSNSAAYVAAVLAALRLGLVFMPLDPDWPPHRLQQLCDEAHPAAVLWAAAGCPGGHGPPAISGWPLVQMPGMAELLQADAGSTGHPLGVLGTQAGVLNRCRWMERAYPFQAGGRVAFKTAPAFVDSVWEVFGPLLAGVPLVALPRSVGRDPAQLLRALADHSITHLAAVPTLWRALLVAMRQNSSTATRLQLRLAVSTLWQQGSVRAFLTGDLGWLDASSCLHLLGRRDHQVKISGVRVDLAEVEATLAQHPGVAAAAAKLWHLPAGPVLAAYVQLAEQQQNGSSIAGNLGSSAAPSSRELQQWCQRV
ncbi:non-ribosomal peptide synthetase [Chlorella sorokiniana]|uniref:Non-ribosomal peptide synthetase n=1 Tax=Chlorella sorokiniana TaxID=3076 RepID=A0A2P6TR78_CHLSO|nr:non-ribosomal peptide synthetase [Chlorella sorokiniana]|eukprot:PRW56561.1 non-ribosomal peptide synthetase [Chlorella sorokiniana]